MYSYKCINGIISTIGKKKTAKAYLELGIGNFDFFINKKVYYLYFKNYSFQSIILDPLNIIKNFKFKIFVNVKGGGLKSQAHAIKHALVKSIFILVPKLKGIYKLNNLIKTDNRIVERKKFGHAKARKSFQFSKR